MAALTNPKHERFAQELAKGKTATEAYVLAGYKSHDGNAATLRGNQRVLDRVAELLNRAATRAEISIASITESLLRIAEKAESLGEASGLSVAKGAWMDAAKVNGLIVDKAENTNRNVDPARVTDAELAAVVQADSSAGTSASPVNPSKLN